MGATYLFLVTTHPLHHHHFYLMMSSGHIFASVSPHWGSSTKALARFMDGTPFLIFSCHNQTAPLAIQTSRWITTKSGTLKFNDCIHLIFSVMPSWWSSGTVFFRPRLTFFLSPTLKISAALICLTRFDLRSSWACLQV